MKTKLTIFIMAMTFVACGGDSNTTSSGTKTEEKEIVCKEVLTATSIKNIFNDAKEINLWTNKYISESKDYCTYNFKLAKEEYSARLTLGATGVANRAMLEQSVSLFKDVKIVEGVGEKAYVYSIGGGQLSTVSDGNLIHVAVMGNKFDKEKTKLLAIKMLEILK